MSSPIVLIIGATGFIGFHVLLEALQQGFTVRAAVRNLDKAKKLPLPEDARVSFVEVHGSYDEAVKGVTHIVHLASPLANPALDPQTGVYEPILKSAGSILEAAVKGPSVRKVVMTASVFANLALDGREITPDTRIPDIEGPFDNVMAAYGAGKIGALNLTDQFVRDNKPHFDVVNVYPGFTFGRDERAVTRDDLGNSTNRLLLGVITGQTSPFQMPAGATWITDAAKVHLLPLKQDTSANLGVNVPHVFNDAWDVVREHFPDEDTFSKGDQPTIPVNWNAKRTETELGLRYKTYGDMVVEVAEQYLELGGPESKIGDT